jgi:gliding motility-associated lipoprotein GldD
MGDMELGGETSMRWPFLIFVAVLFITACSGEADYAPKPRGYYRINFPERTYQQYTSNNPFTFEYPKYAVMERDTLSHPSDKLVNMQTLLNMQFPQFKATLHLSYETIPNKKIFDELVEDAHKFAFKHTVKASSIDEGIIRYPDRKVYGIYYTIDGNAASSVQFYLTDSVKNYLRGALYFNSEPRLDSIQPVLNFVKQDVDRMIKSFKWK